jgi:putative DNA primase/helicase
MDYMTKLRELNAVANPAYPLNDIGVARLFFDLHGLELRYVVEPKSWYAYDGRRWAKDEGGLKAMELCKAFVEAYGAYMEAAVTDEDKQKAKFAAGLTSRKRREGILSDARSIAPMSLALFDRDKTLFNVQNGTYSLNDMALRPHSPSDFITKLARVKYDETAHCERWEQFISEIMCGDEPTARFLQKALGYCLTGETPLECFFILYGDTTRNGKSTLSETVAYIFGDYARTIQPQSLSRRSPDGSAASPDIARLKGARLVNMPEPERGLELNIALIKQLTGGDTYTGRHLHENPIEFRPEFKIFINTNHLPRTADDTVFSSDRVKLIPFDRHFEPNEQDTGLKKQFRSSGCKSAILNWLIEGYRLLMAEGLGAPRRIEAAVAAYRQETDIVGAFFDEATIPQEGSRVPTGTLYKRYAAWAKDNGYRAMNSKCFMAEIRKRYEVRRDGAQGNVAVGVAFAPDPIAAAA